MDGPRDCHTEFSKLERKKQIPYTNTHTNTFPIYVKSRKITQLNQYAKQKETQMERMNVWTLCREREGGMNWEIRVD